VNPSAPFKPPGAAAAPASGTDDVPDEEVMQRLQQDATGDVAPTGRDKPDKKQGEPKPSAAAEKKLAAAEKKRAEQLTRGARPRPTRSECILLAATAIAL
jgi:hypothetical protein